MIRITELALPLDHPQEALRAAILERLNIQDADLLNFTVFKRSYDARKKNTEIKFVYIIDLEARNEDQLLARFEKDVHIRPAPDTNYYPVGHARSERAPGNYRLRSLRSVCRLNTGADGL
jgi:uncharacterized FAD-dependent dehydrogenase